MKGTTFIWIVVALVLGIGAGYFLNTHEGPASATSPKTAGFHDAMRQLWEEHIVYTRLYIVEAVSGNPGAAATAARLLKNQEDIGKAVKPYYGEDAGNQLTALLKTHIQGAVDILNDAKANNQTKLATDKAAWYDNGNQIAAFLNSANPDHWTVAHLEAHMKAHLDVTLDEAVKELQGDYAGSVADYDQVHSDILHMADTLSEGIVAQFPGKF